MEDSHFVGGPVQPLEPIRWWVRAQTKRGYGTGCLPIDEMCLNVRTNLCIWYWKIIKLWTRANSHFSILITAYIRALMKCYISVRSNVNNGMNKC